MMAAKGAGSEFQDIGLGAVCGNIGRVFGVPDSALVAGLVV